VDRVEADLVVARQDRGQRRGDAMELDDACGLARRRGHGQRERARATALHRRVDAHARGAGDRASAEAQPLALEALEVVRGDLDVHHAGAVGRIDGGGCDDEEAPISRDVDAELGRRIDRDLDALGIEQREGRVAGAAHVEREREGLVRVDRRVGATVAG
jgi:hypothetical protein